MRLSSLLLAPALSIALLAGCASKPAATPSAVTETAAPSAPAPVTLIPDHTAALAAHHDDYADFVRDWLTALTREVDADELVSYAASGSNADVQRAAEKLIEGSRAFCSANGGELVPEPPAFTCAGQDRHALARLELSVFDATADQPATLQFSAQSADWIARVTEERMADYRRVLDTLSGNGIAGNVLLGSGENFEVVRFGRLAAPDFYALKTPEHGLTWFTDVLSVKWSADTLSVVTRSGEQWQESASGLTPGKTIVRLRPTLNSELKAEPIGADAPFRFVYMDPQTKQPRQARVRADTQILQITVAVKPGRYRAGAIQTRFDVNQQDLFRKQLTADARKAAANLGRRSDKLDLDDPKMRSDVEQVGRVGACARTQSDDRLRTGDISLSEYLVCGQYRQEADTLKANGGVVTPDKTPLLFLGRAARAPWYDFNGVLR
jgi:hypothetical protein